MRALRLLVPPVVLVCCALVLVPRAGTHDVAAPRSGVAAEALKLPLAFEANGGRTDSRARFIARGSGYAMFFTDRGTVVRVRGRHGDATVRTALVGASGAGRPQGSAMLPGRINSLVGKDPAGWRRGIRAFREIRYGSVYPGVDLLYHGRQGVLEYDFKLAPGASPTVPRLRVSGARLSLNRSGDLLLNAGGATLRQRKPVAYQLVAGHRQVVPARFVVDRGQIGFAVGNYDRSKPLVIDPQLVYGTLLGGSTGAVANGVAVDGSGNAWITGYTYSTDFPTSSDARQSTHGGSTSNTDMFVTRLSPAGDHLVYSTYLGGGAAGFRNKIQVAPRGPADVGGDTVGQRV